MVTMIGKDIRVYLTITLGDRNSIMFLILSVAAHPRVGLASVELLCPLSVCLHQFLVESFESFLHLEYLVVFEDQDVSAHLIDRIHGTVVIVTE